MILPNKIDLLIKMKPNKNYRHRKAEWWIDNVEQDTKRTFKEDLYVLLKNISLHCYFRLIEYYTGFWEK